MFHPFRSNFIDSHRGVFLVDWKQIGKDTFPEAAVCSAALTGASGYCATRHKLLLRKLTKVDGIMKEEPLLIKCNGRYVLNAQG